VGASLARQLLDAHRWATRGPRSAGELLRVDQVVIDGGAAALTFLAFESTGRPRVAIDLVLSGGPPATAPLSGATIDEAVFVETACRRYGALFSRAGSGPAHRVHAARYAAPGRTLMLSTGGVPVAGAWGMLVIGAGEIDVAATLAGSPAIVPAPRIVGVELHGRPSPWVGGEDVVLALARHLPPIDEPLVWLELHGPGVAALPMAQRMAIARRASRLGVQLVLFPSDEVTREALRAQGRETEWKAWAAEAEPAYDVALELGLAEVEPMLERPGDAAPAALIGHVGPAVRAVAIGPEAETTDLRRLARRVDGRSVHPDVRLTVAIDHRQALESGVREGWLARLRTAGAVIVDRDGGMMAGARHGGGAVMGYALRGDATGTIAAGIDACAAAALTAAIADPRTALEGAPATTDEDAPPPLDDRAIVKPVAEAEAAMVVRGPRLRPLPLGRAIAGPLRGVVLLEAGDHVGIDAVLPWGARVRPLRYDVDALARFAFAGIDPAFAARARARIATEVATPGAGRVGPADGAVGGGFLVAGTGFGAGGRRPQAALVAVRLGVRGVMAFSYGAAWRGELIANGILPLAFASATDRTGVAAGDELEIPDLPEGLEPGRPLVVRNLTRGAQLTLRHDLDAREIETVRAGGVLRVIAARRAAA